MRRVALAVALFAAGALLASEPSASAQTVQLLTLGCGTGSSSSGNSGIYESTGGSVCVDAGGTSPSSAAVIGIAGIVSASGEATHALKATPGNLYSVYATNLTATAGFLQIFNAVAAPADGAVTPVDCVPLPSNGMASLNYTTPEVFSVGISVAVSSATTCFTKTTGVITAFIKGAVK